jgi:hypothetical protein
VLELRGGGGEAVSQGEGQEKGRGRSEKTARKENTRVLVYSTVVQSEIKMNGQVGTVPQKAQHYENTNLLNLRAAWKKC